MSSVAELEELTVPTGHWHPNFKVDPGIRRRSGSAVNLTEGGELVSSGFEGGGGDGRMGERQGAEGTAILRNARGSRRVQKGPEGSNEGSSSLAPIFSRSIPAILDCAFRLSRVTACAYTSSAIFALACRSSSWTTFLAIRFQQS